jgi:hypothetical protein
MKKSLHMETTSISVIKTCAEIEAVLLEHNAKGVYKEFKGGQVEGVQFMLEIANQDIPYKLPFRWKAIQRMAEEGKTGYRKTIEEEQARRVAARIALRWIQAQMALVEVGMADMAEVFLPYTMIDSENSFYERILQQGGMPKMLTGKI